MSEDLSLMHSFQIIHGDIKIDNIMWSPSHEKNVFIDFGLSKLLKEKVGQMTKTHYFGTYQYCSSEMKSLLIKNRTGFVDLYFNDLEAFRRISQFWNQDVENVK